MGRLSTRLSSNAWVSVSIQCRFSKINRRGCTWLSRRSRRLRASRVRWRRCDGSRACQGVLHRHLQEGQEGRQGRPEGRVQREQPPGELLAHAPPVVAVLDLKVGFEQVDDRQIRGGLAIGGRAAFQQEPALRARRMGELVEEAGLAQSGSPMTATTWPCPASACSRAWCRAASSACRPTKGVSPRTANACRRVRAGPAPTSSHTSTGVGSPLTGTGPRGVTWTHPSASRRVSAVSRMLPGGASCSMRAARCVVWPMAE